MDSRLPLSQDMLPGFCFFNSLYLVELWIDMKDGYERIMGYEIPTGTFPCWVISDEERLASLKENKPFHDHYPPCFFKLIARLDNNYVEGYLGNTRNTGGFHENILTTYSYLDDYLKRKSVYFSFDRISLYRLINIHPTKPLAFILKRLDSPKAIKQNTAFMIMPFKYPQLNIFYEQHIKAFLEETMKIQVFRADDFNGNDIIIETIYNQIENSEFVIVDTSYENKNAFYEFGYAAAKEKEIITIQNTHIAQSLFFDRAHIRAILYSPDKTDDFRNQLRNTIDAIRGKVIAMN